MDDNEETTGLGVLRSSLRSAVEEGGPLASVISESMRKAGVPEEISVDYEPYRAPEREMPARQTQYRDELMRQLEEAKQKLLTPKPEPKNLLEALSRRFVMPTGKTGDLLIARQERAEKEAEDDLKRRETILNILAKQSQLEREQELDIAAQRRAQAEAEEKARKVPNLSAKAQEIIDLENLANDETKSEAVRSRAQYRLDQINKETPEEDRSVLGQYIRARQMLKSGSPEEKAAARAFLRRGGSLTLPRAREDKMISDARAFLATVNERERAAAFANINPNERQRQIIEAVKLSRKPMYSEIAAQGEFSAELIEDEGEE